MSRTKLESKEDLQELISTLPVEKRKAIVELLHDACMAVNSVEVELIDTELNQASLFDGEEHPTLWCQLYALKKLFGNI